MTVRLLQKGVAEALEPLLQLSRLRLWFGVRLGLG